MTSAGSTKTRLAARVAAGLAAAATVFGIAAFAFTGGNSNTQADEPWECNRTGSVCHGY
ncbi:hypothetical protein [Streptomyces sp. B21-108]|uniref:hypothetical protein n=1 Tax=Streptomyces sp. B21-108 TaxID=3039419 RepID=UPI002FF3D149